MRLLAHRPRGPGDREHEQSGGSVDDRRRDGPACIDFDSDVIFIRSDNYREIAGPDWALHIETSLAEGDEVHVARAGHAGPRSDAGGAHRGGVSPLFVGRADQPLIVTTRNPLAFAAELRFAATLAWTALAGGLLAVVLSLF